MKLFMQNPDNKRKRMEALNEFKSSPEGKKALSKGGQKSGEIAKEKAKLYKEYKQNGGTMTWNEFQKSC